MSINVEAVFSLYPSVVTVKGNDEDLVAYDASHDPILVNIPDILEEEQRLEAEAIAQQEAIEDLKQSALTKLGITEEEFKALTS
jgi:hypothetical protein